MNPERCEFCDGTEAECQEWDDCSSCECCCDSPIAHQRMMRKEGAYWSAYFGQNHGTREERRARLEAMDPRQVSR